MSGASFFFLTGLHLMRGELRSMSWTNKNHRMSETLSKIKYISKYQHFSKTESNVQTSPWEHSQGRGLYRVWYGSWWGQWNVAYTTKMLTIQKCGWVIYTFGVDTRLQQLILFLSGSFWTGTNTSGPGLEWKISNWFTLEYSSHIVSVCYFGHNFGKQKCRMAKHKSALWVEKSGFPLNKH